MVACSALVLWGCGDEDSANGRVDSAPVGSELVSSLPETTLDTVAPSRAPAAERPDNEERARRHHVVARAILDLESTVTAGEMADQWCPLDNGVEVEAASLVAMNQSMTPERSIGIQIVAALSTCAEPEFAALPEFFDEVVDETRRTGDDLAGLDVTEVHEMVDRGVAALQSEGLLE
jgi:hypothetical protein